MRWRKGPLTKKNGRKRAKIKKKVRSLEEASLVPDPRSARREARWWRASCAKWTRGPAPPLRSTLTFLPAPRPRTCNDGRRRRADVGAAAAGRAAPTCWAWKILMLYCSVRGLFPHHPYVIPAMNLGHLPFFARQLCPLKRRRLFRRLRKTHLIRPLDWIWRETYAILFLLLLNIDMGCVKNTLYINR